MIRMPIKKWYPKHKGAVEPDRTIMLMAEARDMLTTWEVTKDKPLVDRHLRQMDKRYGAGSEMLVRRYMHTVKKQERYD